MTKENNLLIKYLIEHGSAATEAEAMRLINGGGLYIKVGKRFEHKITPETIGHTTPATHRRVWMLINS